MKIIVTVVIVATSLRKLFKGLGESAALYNEKVKNLDV